MPEEQERDVVEIAAQVYIQVIYLPNFVYQMGRLCGGAHEISGIKAQIFLRGWVGDGESGGGGVGRGGGGGVAVGRGGVVGWVMVEWGWWGGWWWGCRVVVGGVIRLSF